MGKEPVGRSAQKRGIAKPGVDRGRTSVLLGKEPVGGSAKERDVDKCNGNTYAKKSRWGACQVA